MNAFDDTLAELVAVVEQQVLHIGELPQRLGELEAVSRSADGLVSVTVGFGGQVRAIELDPGVYRRMSSAELADRIVEQLGRAGAAVSDLAEELVAPLLPEGVRYGDVFEPDQINLNAFLPPGLDVSTR
ncbi:YbaB/EbfC family nucleoid-associated protein [Nonomuraea cavernae]|uniref:YbaB/EbfC family DNA-binding protein n=1 Tax=Nonomuraea cavernae TaxID=2045107 RepID=A0A917YWJ3_9ACTN|nr:YbaB/EbfC family nucleoid-associated protein [Nonomuraea cavernae]MCA2187455.1 YbaB/EbfC family nucleoid-associated protein [Nonomuraea cavernae]GGO68676.1 hypothetical protein GCM10012289_28000 [Nonomuraea cavernae]